MFIILSHQRNANLNHTEIQILPHSQWISHQDKHQKVLARMWGKECLYTLMAEMKIKSQIWPKMIWLSHFWRYAQVILSQHMTHLCYWGTIHTAWHDSQQSSNRTSLGAHQWMKG